MPKATLPEGLPARLQALTIFQGLAPARLAALTERMTLRLVDRGEELVTEGDEGDAMFILLRGRVRITKRTLDNEPYTVAMLGEEDTPFFGEQALLDDERRSATISAEEPSELLVLDRETFERFGDEHPADALAVTRQLARLVSSNLRRANEDAVLLFQALVNEVRAKAAG